MAETGSSDPDSPLRRLREWLLSPPLETGSTRLRVGRASDGSWSITEAAAARPLRRFVSLEQALRVATSTLEEARGGQIEVTEEDGSAHLISVPKGKRPWWQVSRSPLAGLFLGLLWLGLFTIRALDTAWPPPLSFDTVAVVFTGVCAALYISSTGYRVLCGRRARVKAAAPGARGSRTG